jgi:hypothetical protein
MLLAAGKPKVPLGHFSAIDIEVFEVPVGELKEPVPEEWATMMRSEIARQVIGLHRFAEVMDFRDPQVRAPTATRQLLLRGRILNFTAGNAEARLVTSMLAGHAKLTVLCVFVDRQTGDVIWERQATGRVLRGDRSAVGTVTGVAKAIAKLIKDN